MCRLDGVTGIKSPAAPAMSIRTEKNRLTQEDGEEEKEEETDWKKTTLLFSDRHSSDIPWASGIATAR